MESNCYCYLTWAGSFLSENMWRSRENVGNFSGMSCFRNRWVISDRSSVPLKVRSRAATSSSADLREESCQSDSSSLTAEESSALSLSSDTPFCEEKKWVYLQSWWQRSSLTAVLHYESVMRIIKLEDVAQKTRRSMGSFLPFCFVFNS